MRDKKGIIMNFKITLGDWSNDGHGKKDNFIYQSDSSIEEIREAYKKGAEITGIDLSEICSEYEDTSVPEKCLEYFPFIEDIKYVSPEEFLQMIINTIYLGNPNIKIEMMKIENFNGYWTPDFNISFGYGLYE